MIRINLLPSAKKKSVKLPLPIIYGIIALVLIVLITGGLTFFLNSKVSAMKADLKAKETKLKQLKSALKEVEDYEQVNAEFRQKTQIIEQLKRNQIIPLLLLDEVSDKLPKGVWLVELVDSGGVISITGYAFSNTDLVSYVQNLKESKYLRDVTLVESRQEEIETFSVYRFKLRFKFKG